MENAGDINSLLLDKTGTMTLGNRQAVEFLTITGVTVEELAVPKTGAMCRIARFSSTCRLGLCMPPRSAHEFLISSS